jgi:hypothetical protein
VEVGTQIANGCCGDGYGEVCVHSFRDPTCCRGIKTMRMLKFPWKGAVYPAVTFDLHGNVDNLRTELASEAGTGPYACSVAAHSFCIRASYFLATAVS